MSAASAKLASALASALVAGVAVLPMQSAAQAPAPQGGVSIENSILLFDAPFRVKVDFRTVTSPPPSSQDLFEFVDREMQLGRMLNIGGGCLIDQSLPRSVFCQMPPVSGWVIRMSSRDDRLKISAGVPKLPGPAKVDAGGGDDKVAGGRDGEKIDPGKGNDKVDAGKGNDAIDARDGEADFIDGGRGQTDTATVDDNDKVKNVEVVKRK